MKRKRRMGERKKKKIEIDSLNVAKEDKKKSIFKGNRG